MIKNFFLLNYKIFDRNKFNIFYTGYLNCFDFCIYEMFNLLNIKKKYNSFFKKVSVFFLSINLSRDYSFMKINYLRKILMFPLNSLFFFYYKKKINLFLSRLFEINFKNYAVDHNLLFFFHFKKKVVSFFSNTLSYKTYNNIIINYNILKNLQSYFNFLNLIFNFFMIFYIKNYV